MSLEQYIRFSSIRPHRIAFDEKEIEGDVGRPAPTEQQVMKYRSTGLVEGHDLTVKGMARRETVQQSLEAPEPVLVLGEHPTAGHVGNAAEPSYFSSNSHAGSSNGSERRMGIIGCMAAGRFRAAGRTSINAASHDIFGACRHVDQEGRRGIEPTRDCGSGRW